MTDYITGDKVNQRTDAVALIETMWMVGAIRIVVNNRLTVLSKDVDVFIAYQFVNFHVGTVIGTDGQGTVQHEFHVTSTGRLLRSQGNLLRNICCRNDKACLSDIVVLNHDNLQVWSHFWIIFDNL